MDTKSKLFHALVSTQGTLHKLLEDEVLPPTQKAWVLAAIASNEPIIEEASNR